MIRTKFNGHKLRRTRKTGPKPAYLGRLDEVERIYKLFGPTTKKVAEYFEVGRSTVDYWIANYADFSEARNRGLAYADAKVVDSLYRRALGYDAEEREYKVITNTETGEQMQLLVRRTIRHVPASEKACMFILSNRHRDEWLTYLSVKHSGKVDVTHTDVRDLPVEELSRHAREALFEITQKQLGNGSRDN